MTKSITCKAAVAIEAKKPLSVIDVVVAPPKAGEVRVRVIANALCHTDLYTLDGHDPEGIFPVILGHEATAEVVDVGPGVEQYKPGDLVVPCYTPECREWDCVFCNSNSTNLCPKVRATQGAGVMSDGTSRFTTVDGNPIYHFMGCSTFSEYTVLSEISLAKINPAADPTKVCLLGCGIATGWGAVINNPNFRANTSVAVWGLGAVGLAVIQAAKFCGATRIYGFDLNKERFEQAKNMGCTGCFAVSAENDGREWILSKEKWGVDFTFDCTGNVAVMQTALELAHRGFGESTVIGVAAAGKMLQTRPFQLVTGRAWKGTAFGGWKSRQDVPKLVNKVMLGELPIDSYITHNFNSLHDVNELIGTLHEGSCLRGVVTLNTEYIKKPRTDIQVICTVKVCGGYLKQVTHWSECNQCEMRFHIFLPEDRPKEQRGDAYPTLYFLSGLGSSDENAPTKSGFAPFAKKANLAMVFPDTSPRNIDIKSPDLDGEDWTIGYGAGHYCDATNEPWSKHFNMYTYVTKELPSLVESYFPVDASRKSVMGFSMGGNGAIVAAAKNEGIYKSLSALAPFVPTKSDRFGTAAIANYYKNSEEAKQYDCVELLNGGAKLPPCFIDYAAVDQYQEHLVRPALTEAIGRNGYGCPIRVIEGYNHSFYFVSSVIEEHINFHSSHLSR